jgi:hypothetical protein
MSRPSLIRTVHQPLAIRFVFVTSDEVSGVLDPYRDPDCGCTLTTLSRHASRRRHRRDLS